MLTQDWVFPKLDLVLEATVLSEGDDFNASSIGRLSDDVLWLFADDSLGLINLVHLRRRYNIP